MKVFFKTSSCPRGPPFSGPKSSFSNIDLTVYNRMWYICLNLSFVMHELEESIMAERHKIRKTVMYTGRARQNKENKSFEMRESFLIRRLIWNIGTKQNKINEEVVKVTFIVKDANCISLCNKSEICWGFLPIFHISKSYIFMQKKVCCDTLSFFANPDDEEQGMFF